MLNRLKTNQIQVVQKKVPKGKVGRILPNSKSALYWRKKVGAGLSLLKTKGLRRKNIFSIIKNKISVKDGNRFFRKKMPNYIVNGINLASKKIVEGNSRMKIDTSTNLAKHENHSTYTDMSGGL